MRINPPSTARRFGAPLLAAALAAALPGIAAAQVVSSGTVTIEGTYFFDFDAGVVPLSADGDVFWRQMTDTTRRLDVGSALGIAYLGVVDYAGLTLADLTAVSYGSEPIPGSDEGNLLVDGAVFAVHTDEGHYAKAVVTGAFDSTLNNGLRIRWETQAFTPAVPEPGTYALMLGGLAGLAALARRRRR